MRVAYIALCTNMFFAYSTIVRLLLPTVSLLLVAVPLLLVIIPVLFVIIIIPLLLVAIPLLLVIIPSMKTSSFLSVRNLSILLSNYIIPLSSLQILQMVGVKKTCVVLSAEISAPGVTVRACSGGTGGVSTWWSWSKMV